MKAVTRFLALILVLMAFNGKSQTTGSFSFEGINRSFIVYTPLSYVPGTPVPLVYVLHGFTQTAQSIMDVSGFNQVADTGNFIVVYPNGVGNAWNTNSGLSGGSTANDIGFISALTDSMRIRYSIDTTRIYSCGFSAGGYMSHRLACESVQCFAAIASVGGTMSASAYADCAPARVTSVLQIHGTSDAIVSYNGGFGGVSVDDVISKWTMLNGCPSSAQIAALPDISTTDNSTVESNEYSPCSSATKVKLLKVLNGGHQWPGTTVLLGGLGNINRDINASAEIWNFFRNFSCNNVPNSSAEIETSRNFLQRIDENHFKLVAETDGEVLYALYDLNGMMIKSGVIHPDDVLDFSAISNGGFILKLSADKGVYRFSLIR